MMHYKRISKKQLGQLLIERNIITQEQLDKALERMKSQRGLIGEILVNMNFATEKDIAQALTCQYGFPYLPLSNYEIASEVVAAIPEDICREYSLIPIDKIGKSLTLAMSNPLNNEAIENIELLTGCLVQVFVSTVTDIKQSIDKYYK